MSYRMATSIAIEGKLNLWENAWTNFNSLTFLDAVRSKNDVGINKTCIIIAPNLSESMIESRELPWPSGYEL